MTGRIVGGVGLGLDDPPTQEDTTALDDQQLAEQVLRDDRRLPLHPGAIERRQGPSRSASRRSIARYAST